MRTILRALRLDGFTWYWLESESTTLGSAALVTASFLLLASNRFGWPDAAWRATTRFLLIGAYGWVGLTLVAFVIVRLVADRSGSFPTILRLVAHAHLPLLVVGVVIQIAGVTLNITGVARWPALFAGLVWMPAMLMAALCAWSDMRPRQAVVAAVLPYLAWVASIGRHLWLQLEHLL